MVPNSEHRSHDTSNWLAEDEVDLRRILGVLLRWRWEIIGLALIAFLCTAAALLALRLTARPDYEAFATVAIARVESNVNFDPKFTTDSQQSQVTDAKARRAALLGLAASGSVADTVAKELADKLNADEKDPSELAKSVRAVITAKEVSDGEVPTTSDLNSDLIRIVARADTPAKAASLADAWAKAYVDQVNAVYGQASSSVSPSVAAQLAKSRTDYQAAQAAWEAFHAQSKIDETQWQVASLQAGLANAYGTFAATQRVLDNARSLREQVANGGEGAAASNAVALQLLKIQAFTQANGNPSAPAPEAVSGQKAGASPSALQVQLATIPNTSAAGMLADLDALIEALQKRQNGIALQVAALPDTVAASGSTVTAQTAGQGEGQPMGEAIAALQSRLRALSAQLDAETTRAGELKQQRDLAWNTYTTLSSKVAELSVAQAAANSEVRFASPALPPARPVSRGSLVASSVLAGLLGLVVGVALAFVADLFDQAPFLSRLGGRRKPVASPAR